jgi:hypothetical protein
VQAIVDHSGRRHCSGWCSTSPIIVADKQRLSGLHHRQHAVAEGQRVRRVGTAFVEILPVIEFASRHHIFGVRKGRDPLAIPQLRVPADMVPMEVRAHHVIDLFGPNSEPGEILDERAVHAVELRPARALLVVADAGVDQDRVASGTDDEAVKAEDQLAGARLDQPRSQQRLIVLDHRRVEIGKELARGEKRALVIGNAGNLERADAGGLHASSLPSDNDADPDCSLARVRLASAGRAGEQRRCSAIAGSVRFLQT